MLHSMSQSIRTYKNSCCVHCHRHFYPVKPRKWSSGGSSIQSYKFHNPVGSSVLPDGQQLSTKENGTGSNRIMGMFSGGTRDTQPPRSEPLLRSSEAIINSCESKIQLHGNTRGRLKTAAQAGTCSKDQIAFSTCDAVAEKSNPRVFFALLLFLGRGQTP